MITWIIHIILAILLGIAFYQDWKFRAISWILFPVIGGIALWSFYSVSLPWKIVLTNLVFVFVVIAFLMLYVSVKRGKPTNIFKVDFGLGDLLFLIAITPLFIGLNYILFFISGMFLSGIIHWILSFSKENSRIPLAGYLAVYLILIEGVDLLVDKDLFYTPVF